MTKEKNRKKEDLKIEKKHPRVSELKMEIQDLRERNILLLADMQNLRKRIDIEKEENIKYRAVGFIIQILPTMDMLEKAISAKDVSEEIQNWLKGFEMILNNFKGILESEGVVKITPNIGDDFNYHWHQGVGEEVSLDVEEGKILEVIQDGYKLKGRLLRPASVVVATSKAKEEEKEKEKLKEN